MSPERGGESESRRVWDLPTRLFHWVLVLLVVWAWASARYSAQLVDVTLRWHRWTGYALLVLLVWRLLWGLAGSPASRFASFVGSPVDALRYGIDVARGRSRPFLGHNPLGAWMVIALLSAVLAQAVLGLFTVEHDDLASGPLARLVAEEWTKPIRRWHHFVFHRVILPLAILHVAVNVFYAAFKRDALIRAMITGVKPAGTYEDTAKVDVEPPSGALIIRAALCLAAAAGLVFAPLVAFGGRL